jgi:two-component system, NarL family, sensor histidine kinase UhpB
VHTHSSFPFGRLWRVVFLMLMLAAWCGQGQAAATPPQRLTSAWVVPAATPSSAIQAAAVPVALPDDWAQSRPGFSGSVRYQVPFDLPLRSNDSEIQALYIERVCSNMRVHLNGHLVFSAGRMLEPVSRHCYDPQLITLPTALLQAQGNVLSLEVVGHALQRVTSRQRAAGISALVVGPQVELAQTHAARLVWAVGLVQWVSLAVGVLGCVLVALGWMQRREEAYLAHFGGLCLAWALLSLRLWLPNFPWSDALTEFLFCIAFVPLTALAVQFLLSHAGLSWRWVKWVFVLQGMLLAALLWLAGPDNLFAVANVAYMLLIAQVFVAVVLHLHTHWQQKHTDCWPIAVPFFLVTCLVMAEVVLQYGLLMLPHVQLMHVAVPLLFIGVASRLLQVFARALRASEEGRHLLNIRVKEITLEIESSYTQLTQLRVEQVTDKERKRIAADLHDDLGAKLLTIVHTSESEHISTLAREALEEMRLSVRGLSGKPMRLADALADWRAETVLRLTQASIEVDWQSLADDVELLLPARGFVQTTRILRESVSNIIKHSAASRCRVQCHIGKREFGLVVQDNGVGIPMELDGKLDRGHGMASMKQRAKQMQGQCLVESGPGYGTVIRLTIPL